MGLLPSAKCGRRARSRSAAVRELGGAPPRTPCTISATTPTQPSVQVTRTYASSIRSNLKKSSLLQRNEFKLLSTFINIYLWLRANIVHKASCYI